MALNSEIQLSAVRLARGTCGGLRECLIKATCSCEGSATAVLAELRWLSTLDLNEFTMLRTAAGCPCDVPGQTQPPSKGGGQPSPYPKPPAGPEPPKKAPEPEPEPDEPPLETDEDCDPEAVASTLCGGQLDGEMAKVMGDLLNLPGASGMQANISAAYTALKVQACADGADPITVKVVLCSFLTTLMAIDKFLVLPSGLRAVYITFRSCCQLPPLTDGGGKPLPSNLVPMYPATPNAVGATPVGANPIQPPAGLPPPPPKHTEEEALGGEIGAIAGTIIGTIAGGYLGGPGGAVAGAGLGSEVGGWLGSEIGGLFSVIPASDPLAKLVHQYQGSWGESERAQRTERLVASSYAVLVRRPDFRLTPVQWKSALVARLATFPTAKCLPCGLKTQVPARLIAARRDILLARMPVAR